MPLSGVAEGVAGNALWHGTTAFFRKLTGRQIRITAPRPQEVLAGQKPLGADSPLK